MPSKITLASYITLTRFILVPVFIYLFLKERYLVALIVLAITGFTDFLDGFLARRLNQRSRLGSLLDPMADKFLMVVSFIALSSSGRIPWLLTGIVLFKDALVTAGVIVLNLMKIRLYYRPTILSKMTTATQIFVLIFSFADVLIEHYPLATNHLIHRMLDPAKVGMMVLAAFLTLATAIQYTYLGTKFYRYGERKK